MIFFLKNTSYNIYNFNRLTDTIVVVPRKVRPSNHTRSSQLSPLHPPPLPSFKTASAQQIFQHLSISKQRR